MRKAAVLALSFLFLIFGSSGVEVEERKGIPFGADHPAPLIHSTDDAPLTAVLLGVFQRRASRSKTPSGIASGFGTTIALFSLLESGNKDPLFPHRSQQDLFQRLGVYRL